MSADFSPLNAAGLNLQAIFDLDALPPAMVAALRGRCDPAGDYRQLLLIGHGGTTLWSSLAASGIASADPIDAFSRQTFAAWFARQLPGHRHAIIYPGDIPVGLQALGTLAGWHHPSPFMVGINARWGTWFAYRVVALADTALAPTRPEVGASPCEGCRERPCVSACPADALAGDTFSLEKCIGYRKRPDSRCRTTCLARLACPVGSVHRYCSEQISHTYGISLAMIERGY